MVGILRRLLISRHLGNSISEANVWKWRKYIKLLIRASFTEKPCKIDHY
jgi:hypothetical protein